MQRHPGIQAPSLNRTAMDIIGSYKAGRNRKMENLPFNMDKTLMRAFFLAT